MRLPPPTLVFSELSGCELGSAPWLAVRYGSSATCQTPVIKPRNPASPVSVLGPVLRESHAWNFLTCWYLPPEGAEDTALVGVSSASPQAANSLQPWQGIYQRPRGNLKVLPGPAPPLLSRSRPSILALIFVKHLLWQQRQRAPLE